MNEDSWLDGSYEDQWDYPAEPGWDYDEYYDFPEDLEYEEDFFYPEPYEVTDGLDMPSYGS